MLPENLCAQKPSSYEAFSKSTFDMSKILTVVFVGEPSVDEGGPRREFFRLALKEIFAHSGLFI